MKYKIVLICSAILVFLFHGGYALNQGVIVSDDSIRYLQWSDELISNYFNIFNVESQAHNYVLQYMIFIYLLAIFKIIFSKYFLKAVVLSNVLFNSLTVLVMLSIIFQLIKNECLLIIAAFFYLICYDIIIWDNFVLSDSLYLLLSFIFFAYSISAFNYVNGVFVFNKRKWFIAIFLLLTCLLTRPTSVALVFYFIIFSLTLYYVTKNKNIQLVNKMVLLILLVVTLLFVLWVGYILSNPTSWNFGIGKAVVNYYSARFMDGAVVHDRFTTYVAVKANVIDFIYLAFLRFIRFFAVTVDGYSTKHSIYNMLWFVPVYILSLFSFIELFRKKSIFSPHVLVIVLLCFIYIYVIAVFTSVTLLDYDYRYRLPVLPVFIVMAILGFYSIFYRLYIDVTK